MFKNRNIVLLFLSVVLSITFFVLAFGTEAYAEIIEETLDESKLEEVPENTQFEETADLIPDEDIEQDPIVESILEETKVDQKDEILDSDSELIEDELLEEIFPNPEEEEIDAESEENASSVEETLYTTTSLHVRPYKGAQTNLGFLPKGTAVTGYKDGTWFRFTYQGQEAYIALRWTSTEAPPVEETLFTTTSLHVRPYKGAQTNLGFLPKGTAVTGYKDGTWFRFTYQGQEAYIALRWTSTEAPPVEETLFTTTSLHVRPYKGAQTNLGVLPKGTAVTGYKDGTWFRFTYQGQEAYIALRWTSTEAPPVEETLYTTTSLHVRPYKGAQTNLGVLPKGTAVTGYKDGTWFRFTYQGQEAYIALRWTSTEAPPVKETLYTTTSLYVRPYKGAQTNLGVLPKGTAVTGYKDGTWFRFTYQSQEAYIALRWTSTEAPPVEETLYTTTSLYVRPYKGAQTNLGVLPKGTAVTGYKDGTWFRFTYQGQEAYIAVRYTKKEPVLAGTLKLVLDEARKWIGVNEKNNGHYYIIDTYNNQPNLPRGMRVGYDAHWCDVFVSFIGIRTNTTHILGSEAYVPYHMNYFMNKRQWIENGSIVPRPGDIAFFNWTVSSQPNYAVPGHISIVESVHDGYFYSIDGNVFQEGVWGQGHVVRRKYMIGAGTIRGFARPAYQ